MGARAVSLRMQFRVKDLLKISVTSELVILQSWPFQRLVKNHQTLGLFHLFFFPLQVDDISLVSCSQDGCSSSHHHVQTH